MAIRKSVRALSVAERTEFTDAVRALKSERTAPGAISTYDQFVVTHVRAMNNLTPHAADSGSSVLARFFQDLGRRIGNQNLPVEVRQFLTRRNSAHRGPAFLPWHRQFLRLFEQDLQRISGNADLAIPYWDWEVDGELPTAEQRNTSARSVWQLLGGDGNPGFLFMVTDGPFGFDSARLGDPEVFSDEDAWLTVDPLGRQVGFLQREMGRAIDRLPTQAEFDAAIAIEPYDSRNWDEQSSPDTSFRNMVEGWLGPGLHNQVHVWVGGSMEPGTSPNDPVFFLHHCNIDRLWALWQQVHPNSPYQPETGGPLGHNMNDFMYPWNGVDSPLTARPADLLTLESVEYADPPRNTDDFQEPGDNAGETDQNPPDDFQA